MLLEQHEALIDRSLACQTPRCSCSLTSTSLTALARSLALAPTCDQDARLDLSVSATVRCWGKV
jgi:hypothetical protein